MKCKITEREKKERLKKCQTLFKELQKLNPKREFWLDVTNIHVNTDELWKLNLPEDCEILFGKNKDEFKEFGLGWMIVKYQEKKFYIYSW